MNTELDFRDIEDGVYECRYNDNVESKPFLANLKRTGAGFKFEVSPEVLERLYFPGAIEEFLKGGIFRVVKRNGKVGFRHGLIVWSKTDFTVYPERAGIPLYCVRIAPLPKEKKI